MRIFKAGLAGLVVVAVCLVGIAGAHTKYFPGTILARFEPAGASGTYSGKVISSKQACKANRNITISDSRGRTLGQGSSDSKGDFSFHGKAPPRTGTVEAEAAIKRIGPKTRKHKHFCLAGRTHVTVLR